MGGVEPGVDAAPTTLTTLLCSLLRSFSSYSKGQRSVVSTTGPHWTIDQTNKVMEQRGVNEDPVKFWAAMNMIYSDFVNVAKKLGISNVDFYTEMTRAFLDDKDISGDKLAKYYEYVVK